MKGIYVTGLLMAFCLSVSAQSKTTEALHKKFEEDSFTAFFYHNTLRMLNQNDSKEFDELIKNIEKMKFVMVDKTTKFGKTDYKKLVTDYKAETFEEIMTSRYQGKNFDIFLKEKAGKTQGMVVLVNDSTNLYVLDIVGSIALDKATSLFSTIDDSADIGKQIKNFTTRNNKRKEDDK